MEILSNVYAPYIGANGNWYVNNEDTGVKAQGPAGPQGPAGQCGVQGLAGEKGETGDKGDNGARGEVGARGSQGAAGHCGIQGLIGPKGETGDRGPQGIQGPVGATGVQGSKGEQGDKGDTGAQGPKGDTPELSTSLEEVEEGRALDATMGKTLNDKVTDLNRKLTTHERFAVIPVSDVTTKNQYCTYNVATKRVSIMFSFTANSPIPANATIATIPEKYRPSDRVTGIIHRYNDLGAGFIACTATSQGNISQQAGAGCNNATLQYDYYAI